MTEEQKQELIDKLKDVDVMNEGGINWSWFTIPEKESFDKISQAFEEYGIPLNEEWQDNPLVGAHFRKHKFNGMQGALHNDILSALASNAEKNDATLARRKKHADDVDNALAAEFEDIQKKIPEAVEFFKQQMREKNKSMPEFDSDFSRLNSFDNPDDFGSWQDIFKQYGGDDYYSDYFPKHKVTYYDKNGDELIGSGTIESEKASPLEQTPAEYIAYRHDDPTRHTKSQYIISAAFDKLRDEAAQKKDTTNNILSAIQPKYSN